MAFGSANISLWGVIDLQLVEVRRLWIPHAKPSLSEEEPRRVITCSLWVID